MSVKIAFSILSSETLTAQGQWLWLSRLSGRFLYQKVRGSNPVIGKIL